VPEFRALMNRSDVDVFDFLRHHQTRRREQKKQKSSAQKRMAKFPAGFHFRVEVYLTECSKCSVSREIV